jgi:CheY-like chemotaxis protein
MLYPTHRLFSAKRAGRTPAKVLVSRDFGFAKQSGDGVHSGTRVFDIVLADYMTPEMSGIELVRTIGTRRSTLVIGYGDLTS